MKKIKYFVILALIFMLGVTLTACGGSEGSTEVTAESDPNSIPKFSAMAITEKSPLKDQATLNSLRKAKLLGENEEIPAETPTEGETQTETPTGEEGTDAPGTDDKSAIEVPEDNMPETPDNAEIEDNLLPEISVAEGANVTPFYAEVNQEVFVSVSIVNPKSFAILRFTLNGVVYQSYQFETGSTSELLVLKVNSGDAPGIVEFTIDEIKYVSDVDNQIRDAIIAGNQTVKLSVAYDKIPTASVNNETQDFASYQASIFVSDPLSLVDFEKGNCKLYFYDGEKVMLEKALVKGANDFKVDNLVMGKSYQYMVIANYDGLTKDGFSTKLLLKKDVNTSMFLKLSNVSTTHDELSFDYKVINKMAKFEGAYLLKDGEAIAEADETLKFSGLLSNTAYEIRVYFSFDLNNEHFVYFDSFKTKTQVHKVPTLNATFKVYESSVEYRVVVDDDDDLLKLKSIMLYTQNGDFVDKVSYDVNVIENLNRNANYVLKFLYSYDLNDGNGEVEAEKVVAFSTTKFVPEVEIRPFSVTKDEIRVELVVTDPNVVGRLNSIRLYKAAGRTFVAQLNDFVDRTFKNLTPNTKYIVEVGYVYDLDDGNGSQMTTFELELSTAKQQPTFDADITATEDGYRITSKANDPDQAGQVKSVEVILDGAVIKEVEGGNLVTVTGLLSNKAYTVKVNYEYDLCDLNGVQSIVVEREVRTLEKVRPVVKALGDEITTSSFNISLNIYDPNKILTLKKLEVKLGTVVVKEITDFENDMSLTGLYSNNRYEVVAYQEYDLNDGNGTKEYQTSSFITTLRRDKIVYEYTEMQSGVTSIGFAYKITDKEKLSRITAIELFDGEGNLVQSLDDLSVRVFENLEREAFYSIVTTFVFDMNDGKGEVEEKVSIKYGTSGSKIYVNSLEVINNATPKVGEEVTVEVMIDNPNDLNITALYISNKRYEVVNNSANKNDIIIKFVPDTEGGVFTVEVTGYEYESAGAVMQDLLTSDFIQEILVMGELKVVDYFAISDTYYENFASAALRILEIENPTGYEVVEIGYGDASNPQKTTNFEMIDQNHILIKEIGSSNYGQNERDLPIVSIKYGVDDVYRDLAIQQMRAPLTVYSSVYHIKTIDDLLAIDTNTDGYMSGSSSQVKYYVLDNDIDATGVKWEGIKAAGVFDGNGHSIKNIRTSIIDEATNSYKYYGVFKEFSGIIFDLNVDGLYMSIDSNSTVYVGGICANYGRVYSSSITNSTIEVKAPVGTVVGISNSPSPSDRRSTNNYAENLIIKTTKKTVEGSMGNEIRAAFMTTNFSEMKDGSTLDISSIVIGNSYVEMDGVVSYPLYTGDTKNLGGLYIGSELVDKEYHIHTNCEIDDIIKTGVAISAINVERKGYFLSWYDNPEFTGEPVTFPYNSYDKLDLYAKWTRYVDANPNYTYRLSGWWDDQKQRNVEGYVITSFGDDPLAKENIFVIGGYYNGKPVFGVSYELARSLRLDADGNEKWDIGYDKYVVYYLDTVNFRYSDGINAKTYYFAGKVIEPRANWNSIPDIHVPKEYEDYYNNYWGWNQKYMDPNYRVKTYTDQNNPFDAVSKFAATDEENAFINVKTANAANLLDSIKYDFKDVPYTFENDDENKVKYMTYNGTKFAIIGTNVYAGVERIFSDETFKYIEYSNGDYIIDSLVNKNLTSINLNDLPYDIVRISPNVFEDSKLQTIVLNERLTEIGKYAFNRSQITEIVFPSTLKSIGEYSFANNSNLRKVVMNNKLTNIPDYAFYRDQQLSVVVFSTRLKTIGRSAFQECYQLQSIILPRGVEVLNENAFWFSNLKIFVPATVKTITRAFYMHDGQVTIYTPYQEMPNGWKLYYDYESSSNQYINIIYNVKEVKENDEYVYVVDNDNNITITKCKKSSISKLEFNFEEGSVVGISDRAFEGCAIGSIVLPETLKVIGMYAFSMGSDKSTIVEIPTAVEEIGSYAFSSNYVLVTKAASPKDGWDEEIANRVMYSVDELVNGDDFVYAKTTNNEAYILGLSKEYTKAVVNFEIQGVKVVSVASNLFKNNNDIRTVIVPEGVKSIGEYAFYSCHNLTTVTLPESLESIGRYAFYNMWNLRSIDIPSKVTRIEDYTFASSNSLTNVTFSDKLEYIGTEAFSYTNITKFIVPDTVKYVGTRGLRINYRGYIVINSDVKIPEGWASDYYGGSWESDIPTVIYGDEKNYVVLNINADYDSQVRTIYPDGIDAQPLIQLWNGSTIEGWYTDPDFTNEALFPFNATEHLTNIYAKVKRYVSVDYFDGNMNSNLTGGYIPYVVYEPELSRNNSYATWYMDYNCTIPVEFPYTVNDYTTFYVQWKSIPIQTVGNLSYYVNKNDETILVGYNGEEETVDLSVIDSLDKIGNNVFQDNRFIKNVIIPNTVKSIGAYAFFNSSLETIVLPESVRTIGNNAFSSCYSLRSVSLNEGLETVEAHAFNNTNLQLINIPTSVVTIGTYAFRINQYGFVIVNSADKPEGWETLFAGDQNYSDSPRIVYEDGMNYILLVVNNEVRSDFQRMYTEEIQTKPELSFYNSDYTLEKWYLDEELTQEASFPLGNNSHITYLYPKVSRYIRIYKYVENSTYDHTSGAAPLVVYEPVYTREGYYVEGWYKEYSYKNKVEFPYTATESFTLYPKLVEVDEIEDKERQVYYYEEADGDKVITSYGGNATTVDLSEMENVIGIGSNAFSNNKKIQTVILPESLKFVGANAFSGCTNLSTIVLPNSVTSIGDKAFYQCSNLTTFAFPTSLTYLGSQSFWNCNGLTSVTLPEGLTRIESNAFGSCYNLKEVKLPSTLTYISYGVFSSCNSLENINLPEGLTTIESDVFSYCSKLLVLEIPSTVTRIEYRGVATSRYGVVIINSKTSMPYGWSSNYYGQNDSDHPTVICNNARRYVVLIYNNPSYSDGNIAHQNFIEKTDLEAINNNNYNWYTDPECTHLVTFDDEDTFNATEHIVYLYAKEKTNS